jgi:hypothetical protein
MMKVSDDRIEIYPQSCVGMGGAHNNVDTDKYARNAASAHQSHSLDGMNTK